MKKTLTLTVLFLCASVLTSAQSKQDIFSPSIPMTWLGVDFSGAKVIGDRERLATQSDVMKLMTDINALMKAEASKYDVAGMVDRDKLEMDLEVTNEHNSTLDVNEMFSENQSDHLALTQTQIREIVSNYDFKGHSGLGVMVNIGALNKNMEEGVLYWTFINMDTHEVLMTQQYIQKPGGFSIRNYWARIIYDSMERIHKKDFDKWKNSYK